MARSDANKSKRKLRELAGEAHARELNEVLRDLDSLFTDWREGRIDGFQLKEAIHHFHQGPSRHLYKLYGVLDAQRAVGRALARGILDRKELDDETYAIVQHFEVAFGAVDD